MNPEYKNLTKIPYFRRVVLQNFPFIEEDFDALTDYALLCKVVEYLNKVIKQQNLVNDNTNSLYQSYIQLKNFVDNYFDNLDVQEEINNKLDEMADSGELETILLNYTSVLKTYNTFSDLISDYENLSNNMRCQTLGFYSVGDGGESTYFITDTENSSIYQVDLGNNLYANLINDGSISVKQLGAYADGVHDDSSIFTNAINYFRKIIVPKGTYNISNTIDWTNNTKLITIEGFGNVNGSNISDDCSVLLGNTGTDPVINLLGTGNIIINNLNIISGTINPSYLGILQGCTETRHYSQWIYLNNIYIRMDSIANNVNVNGGCGSVCIYNFQSELNSYNNVFLRSDTPFVCLADDDFEVAQNFGAIRPQHDSLTHNTYNNLMLQSDKDYSMYLSGSSLYFEGLYCQKPIVLRPTQTHSNQILNLNIKGLVENASSLLKLENGADVRGSFFNINGVGVTNFIDGTGYIRFSYLNLSDGGGNITDYSTSNIQITSSLIFKNRNNISILNSASNNNLIFGADINDPINNLSILRTGNLMINGFGFGLSSTVPTRTDLPDNSIILNCSTNDNYGFFKYNATNTTWEKLGPSKVMLTTTGTLSTLTPSLIGQLAKATDTDDIYIAYNTTQGSWKKIT